MLYSIHKQIKDKPQQWQSSYGDNWQTQEGTLKELQDHVNNGGAFIGAVMSNHHRNSEAFVSSDLAVVDVDHGMSIEEFLKHPMAEHAAWVYTTCSHTDEANRYRVIFVLPEVITAGDVYRAVVTALISELGSDKACKDSCRIFYGNSNAINPLWQPLATLPASFIVDAYAKAKQDADTFKLEDTEYDDVDIAKAIHCLEHVIEPTADGQREEKFLPITMACSSIGAAVFPAWSDWSYRGHHGKKGQQSSERYFRTAKSNRHGIGTIFYWANQDDPNWAKNLPEELKGGRRAYSIWESKGVAGYEFEDFVEDDFGEGAASDEQAEINSQYDNEGTWYAKFGHLEPTYENYPDEDQYTPSDTLIALAEEEESNLPPEPDFDDDEPTGTVIDRSKKKGPMAVRCMNAVETCMPNLRHNLVSGDVEWGPLSDTKVISIDEADRLYLDISLQADEDMPKSMVKDCVFRSAIKQPYSPVKKYLNKCSSLPPIDYFTTIASTLFGLPEEGPLNPRLKSGQLLADAIMQRFFIGAVARAFDPGCVHDWMPILVGSQACGKSSFLKYIVPPMDERVPYPWATTIQQDLALLANKPHKLHAGWIVILDECERYFDKRHVERLKNLISTSVDRSDLKYRNEASFPRSFVLAGACNSADFLTDPTGNRRFMPIPIVGIKRQEGRLQIDLDRVKRDRNRIWSAAYQAWQDNPVHTFDSAEIAEAQEFIATFQVDNPLESKILSLTRCKISGSRRNRKDGEEQNYWCVGDILDWMDIPKPQQPSMTMHVTEVLKRYSFQRVRVMRPGFKHAQAAWVKGMSHHS